ncbi:GspH/FimT family pseudopilin [Massilia sp. TS11]|uniref:GspH/FimT family pseudopilin n=1 Tax=Massilia sp. TS11 TaxID=2908003 RepID=UPI001ED9E48F|nr:GspH/FimT family pseudopilin [Massilia sp. TS11]MCG2585857.1 GspH/FimT family pseudopilin [Massilia sp. TS11]
MIARRPARLAGFTLVELLVVMVILGATLGMVSYRITASAKQALHNEAQRIALLLQTARDEAIVRNRQIAFEAGSEGYAFGVRKEDGWETLQRDELLHPRQFQHRPLVLTLDPPSPRGEVRIVFGREPVDKPFRLRLADGEDSVLLRADGIGHFEVQ